jgi:hypothetical protein
MKCVVKDMSFKLRGRGAVESDWLGWDGWMQFGKILLEEYFKEVSGVSVTLKREETVGRLRTTVMGTGASIWLDVQTPMEVYKDGQEISFGIYKIHNKESFDSISFHGTFCFVFYP